MKKDIMIKSTILVSFVFILSSCLKENTPLINSRVDYLGDNLRIDGFYYEKKPDGTLGSRLTFFYKNGVKFVVTFSEMITDPVECVTILTKDRVEADRKRKYNWGIFIIKNNDFFCEEWSTPINGNYVNLITQTGEILSDTCIMITTFNNGNTFQENLKGMMYFYPYNPKPDSTNIFIE